MTDWQRHFPPLKPWPTSVGQLKDVATDEPEDGDTLIYDAASGQWKPGPAAAAVDSASDVPYDNAGSGLLADDVQAAIDELAAGEVGGIGSQIGYARTTSSTAASTSASIPMDTTRPQNTEGTAYPSIDTTITPHAAASLLEVEVTISYLVGTTAAHIIGALFRDSGADAIAVGLVVSEAGNRSRQLTLRTVVSAGSTTATTFKFRFGVNAGTCYLLQDNTGNINFGGACVAAMTIREIKQ